MAEAAEWRILCVDDDPTITRQVHEYLDGEPLVADDPSDVFRVDLENRFDKALEALEKTRYDAVILDLRLGDPAATPPKTEAGEHVLKQIQERQFLPVIFYTGLPMLLAEHYGTLIRVVEKTEGVDRLLEQVREVFAEGLPKVNRLLMRHIEEVQRDYMWRFVSPNWERISGGRKDGTELAYLLARRLAASLTDASVQELAARLGGGSPPTGDRYHPVRLYLMPPVSAVHMPGELLTSEDKDKVEYRVLLTPACDMVQNKAEFVLVARCIPLMNTPEYKKHGSAPSGSSRAELKKLMGNKLERYYFFPAAVNLPDLVADFQQLETFPCGKLTDWERLAVLDSPFAQAFLSQFTRYLGRLGTPDLDIDGVIARIEAANPASAEPPRE